MKIFTIVFTWVLLCSVIIAQTPKKESIKRSDTYYWGEAISENQDEASERALSQLTRQIAVLVSSDFRNKVTEDNGDISEQTEMLLNTYSTATLKNVKTLSDMVDGRIEVFHYIDKSEVVKIFEERKQLIGDLYRNAIISEKSGYYRDALTNYYFSLVLMNSIPETNLMQGSSNLSTEIPNCINSIINNTRFKLISDENISEKERELILEVTVDGKPVKNLDFTFWDGTKQIEVKSKDGEGILQLVGSSISFDELKVNVKYAYSNCREQVKEVDDIWKLVKRPSFAMNQTVKLKMDKPSQIPLFPGMSDDIKVERMETNDFKIDLVNEEGCDIQERIGKVTLQLLGAIERRDFRMIEGITKNDTLTKKIKDLIKYNDLVIVGNTQGARINKTYEGWELRKIKVLNRYSSINEQSKEYLVIDFTEDGNLYDLTFGIMDGLYEEFVEQANYAGDWENRLVIIKFMEKYRTAYLQRNIAMLDSIFAEEAVIIVGRVVRKNMKKDVAKFANQVPDVEYTQYTKKEYLVKQQQVFNMHKDIYLGFSNFKIRRKNKAPSFYGISLRQNYHATKYADEGHLFLLVDFPDGEDPQIYVRSWQPQEWDMNKIIDTGYFNINQ